MADKITVIIGNMSDYPGVYHYIVLDADTPGLPDAAAEQVFADPEWFDAEDGPIEDKSYDWVGTFKGDLTLQVVDMNVKAAWHGDRGNS